MAGFRPHPSETPPQHSDATSLSIHGQMPQDPAGVGGEQQVGGDDGQAASVARRTEVELNWGHGVVAKSCPATPMLPAPAACPFSGLELLPRSQWSYHEPTPQEQRAFLDSQQNPTRSFLARLQSCLLGTCGHIV